MYVNPFWFGVLVTIAVELVVIVVMSMIHGGDDNE